MARRNRSRFRALISSPFSLVVVGVLFVVIAKASWSIHEKAVESRDRLDVAEADLAEAELKRDEIAERVDKLSTTAGLRAEVRDKYHAVEPGESVAVIVDPAPDRNITAASVQATSTPAAGKGFWAGIWSIFKRD